MEIFELKAKVVGAGSPSGQGVRDAFGLLGRLSISFDDLLRRADWRIESGITTISDRAGITAIGERPDAASPGDDRDRRRDDAVGRAEGRAGHEDRRDDQRATRAERDDGSRGEGAEHRNERAEAKGDNGNHYGRDRGDEGRGDGRDGTDTLPTNHDGKGGESKSAKGASSDGDGGAPGGGAAGEASAHGSPDGSPAVHAGAAARQQAQLVLAGLVAALDATGLPQQAAPQAVEHAQSGDDGSPAKGGLLTALAAVGKETHLLGGQAGQGQAQGPAQTANLGANPAAQAEAQNESKAALAGDGAARQAETLARLLGDGRSLQVAVTVTDDADVLMSKPGALLTAGASLAVEGAAASQGGQTASGGGQYAANPAAVQTTLHAGQGAQAGAGQPAAAEAAQAAGGASAQATQAKGPAQVPGSLHGSPQGAQAGGAENAQSAPAASGEGREAQHGRESASAKPAQAPHAPVLKHPVMEQVSVKIAKAVNAGADRITVQLRPPELGRIEVRMEVTYDGRTQAALVADNRDTLEMLRRDAGDLAKALQEAGLKLDVGDLSFSMRGGNERQPHGGEDVAARGASEADGPLDDARPGETGEQPDAVIVRRYGIRGRAGVDVQA